MHNVIEEPKKWFHCKSGRNLKSLEDFKRALRNEYASEHREAFIFHSKNNNNDFANWIRDVIKESELAGRIRTIHKPEKTLELIKAYEEELKNKEQKTESTNKDAEKEPVPEEFSKPPVIDENKSALQKIKEQARYYSDLSDKIEERVKTMKNQSKKNPKQTTGMIEKIEDEYKKIYELISEERKNGTDVFIPGLRIRNVKPKIEYLKVTQNKSDYEEIKKIFQEIQEDIKEAREHQEPNLKKEIMNLVKKEESTQEVS